MKTVSSIFGVLGFFISITTFILTRIERRKKLLVELYIGYTEEYADEYAHYTEDDYAEVIKIRATNIGGQPVVINPQSFFIYSKNETINTNKCDWFGIDKVPSPLKVGESCEVAICTESFIDLLRLKELDKFCNTEDASKTLVPLYVSLTDHAGKIFSTKKFNYYYIVNSLERTK